MKEEYFQEKIYYKTVKIIAMLMKENRESKEKNE
jgi:hypothetical protein